MEDKKVTVTIPGRIWAVPAVSQQPVIVLCRWRVLEIIGGEMGGKRHLVGYNIEDREGRTSTAVVAFDQEKREFKTVSGRIYRLDGPSGHDRDGEFVWRFWVHSNQITDFKDVSNEY